MSVTVEFWSNFSKQPNSTKQPSGTATVSLDMFLKDPCSIQSPVLRIRDNTISLNPSLYNYAHISLFSRYYYVEDWTWDNGVWECALTVDVLATYKTQIGSSSQYVLRSAKAYNGEIIDTMYPANTDFTTVTRTLTSQFTYDLEVGCYVVGIISNDATASQGAITYYVMSATEMGKLKGYLMSDAFMTHEGLDALTDISSSVLKTIYNPYQYIASCRWFPFTSSFFTGTTVSSIKFGWWTVDSTIVSGLSAKKLSPSNAVVQTGNDVVPPTHPLSSNRGSYLNKAPFTQHTLYYPPFGIIPIDTAYLTYASNALLMCNIDVDAISGSGTLSIYTAHTTSSGKVIDALIYRNTVQLAIEIQLASMAFSQNEMGAIGLAGNLISSGVQSLFGSNGITNAISGIGDALAIAGTQLQSNGTNGSVSQFKLDQRLVSKFTDVVADSRNHKGRPLCENRTISTLGSDSTYSGYILVADADISITAFPEEKSQIKSIMESGFFYE